MKSVENWLNVNRKSCFRLRLSILPNYYRFLIYALISVADPDNFAPNPNIRIEYCNIALFKKKSLLLDNLGMIFLWFWSMLCSLRIWIRFFSFGSRWPKSPGSATLVLIIKGDIPLPRYYGRCMDVCELTRGRYLTAQSWQAIWCRQGWNTTKLATKQIFLLELDWKERKWLVSIQ